MSDNDNEDKQSKQSDVSNKASTTTAAAATVADDNRSSSTANDPTADDSDASSYESSPSCGRASEVGSTSPQRPSWLYDFTVPQAESGGALYAVAPMPTEDELNPVADLKNSEAYRALEQLHRDGLITPSRMAHLKVKFAELNETLKSYRVAEGELRQRVRDAGQRIDVQRQQLATVDGVLCSPREMAGQLRCTLLDYRNELNETNERMYRLDSFVEGLEFDRKEMQDRYEALQNAADMELKIRQLTAAVSALTHELASRRVEKHSLQGDLDSHVIYIAGLKRDLDECRADIESMKFDADALVVVRNRLLKDCEKLTRQHEEEENRLAAVRADFKKLNDEVVRLTAYMDEIGEQKRLADADTAAQRDEMAKREQAFAQLRKNYEYAKEQARWLQEDRVVIDINRKHAVGAYMHMVQQIARLTHDKVQDLIRLKRKETQKRLIDETCRHLHDNLSKLGTQLIMYPRVDEAARQRKQHLQRDVNDATRALMHQNVTMVTEIKNVEELMLIEEKLLYVENEMEQELHGLQLTSSIR